MTADTRIESLETQVRTLKRMLLGVFGVVVVGGLLAATSLQSVPDVVRAKKFEVVNGEGKEGKVVAEIYANLDGGVLVIKHNDGKPVASIQANQYGGLLGVSKRDGEPAVGIFAHKDQGGVIMTMDNEGQITSVSP